jgi:hypothetical protein
MEAEVVKCVRDIGLEEQVYYSSFNHESVHQLSKLVGPKFCGLSLLIFSLNLGII